MKELKNYEKIVTEDGSETLFSKIYNEACHSTSGAGLETQLHYIKGCKIMERLRTHIPLNIFEVGLGVGIGFLETLKVAKGSNFNFISTEIDDELIQYFLEKNELKDKAQEYFSPCHYYQIEVDNYKLIILQGNARESIMHLEQIFPQKIHAIYQDAFSPKRNAILWTTQWFEQLKNIAHIDCIMSTYSSSSSIRKSMIQAGWKVYQGDKFGPKRSSTRARLTGESDTEIEQHLQRSPAITLTDDNYKNYKLGV